MSKIARIRILNLNYNNNTIKIDDETFDLGGQNTLISLRNGGGKSVLVQMIVSLFVNRTYRDFGDRPFKSYFTTNRPTFLMTEWQLDNNSDRFLAGMMVRKNQKEDNDIEELEIYTFTGSYYEACKYDLDNLPIIRQDGNKKILRGFSECKNLLEDISKKEAGDFRLYDMTSQYGRQQYFTTLRQYQIKPSKQLQDALANMLKGNQEFVMLDEQKVVYESILDYSCQCQKDGKKRTIIVEGGPGTGKTVIAINLLAELTNRMQFVQYVSKNAAPRTVYQFKLKGHMRKNSIDNLFKGSGSYTEAPRNSVGTLLADEAHRLNEKSGMFQNMGENQIKEIIHAAACSVFFIDESQRVTLSDIGSVAEIEKWAALEKSEIIKMQLVSQFRCNGSDGYLAWLDQALEIRETANYDLDGMDYDIRICDTPAEMEAIVVEKNRARNRARILAGYCWNWPKATRNNTNFHDIEIGDYSISWNLNGGDAFAISEESVHEAGCIHTSQGLEFDYTGVIIGDDMRFENGKVITDYTKRAKTDNSLKGIKTLAKKDKEKADQVADEIIKNTYRTLMTRGMKGCYVYCTDAALAQYFKKLLKQK